MKYFLVSYFWSRCKCFELLRIFLLKKRRISNIAAILEIERWNYTTDHYHNSLASTLLKNQSAFYKQFFTWITSHGTFWMNQIFLLFNWEIESFIWKSSWEKEENLKEKMRKTFIFIQWILENKMMCLCHVGATTMSASYILVLVFALQTRSVVIKLFYRPE